MAIIFNNGTKFDNYVAIKTENMTEEMTDGCYTNFKDDFDNTDITILMMSNEEFDDIKYDIMKDSLEIHPSSEFKIAVAVIKCLAKTALVDMLRNGIDNDSEIYRFKNWVRGVQEALEYDTAFEREVWSSAQKKVINDLISDIIG